MSAIRPLATIAILAALGVFLFQRINQDPLADTGELTDNWGEAPSYAPGGDEGGAAPAFSPAPGFEPPTAPQASFSTVEAPPTAPEFPELPPLPSPPPVSTASAGLTSPTAVDPSEIDLPELSLPASIPTADYSGGPPTAVTPPAGGQVSGRVPSLGTATPDQQTPTAPGWPASNPPVDPYGAPAIPATASSADAPPFPTTPERDALAGGARNPAIATPPSAPIVPPAAPQMNYASARPAIQAALDRDELPRAHLLLSQWYGDSSLSPTEQLEVKRLLSQLAGTVVYSTEHRLEPPHQVQPGETLESIAKQYNTPWQLLAKINGVSRSDGVKPGQIIKVLRGPFSAVVDLSDAEIYLSLDGRYAGRFPVQVAGTTASEGGWKVAQKESLLVGMNSNAKKIVLQNPAQPGGSLRIGASPSYPGGYQQPEQISVAAKDLNDLYDILSEGSEVTIRR